MASHLALQIDRKNPVAEHLPRGLSSGPPAGISLRLDGVGKTFPGRDQALQALLPTDLFVAAGAFVTLLGPSGCGKSTLLGLIAGLDAPTTGTILADGRPVRGPGTERVLLFQEAALFPWLDVRGNVEFGLRQLGVPARERRKQADHLLERVHLADFARSYTHQLSGGMRQRVAIARALALDPAVLLMDEPFGALDALTRDQLYAELEEIWLASGKTILFVTHNVREAVALGDRVLVFAPRPGRIVRDIKVDLPRTRSLEDHAVVDRSAEVLAVLREAMTRDGGGAGDGQSD
jgi:NitT/TauT family transport system ATP-binding protein